MRATLTVSRTADAARGAAALPWLCLALYFGAQLLSRVYVSDALELDEAEQMLWTQQLQLGYGAQPPLYTWLQWGVFQVFGVSVFSLALLKNVLLAATYVFVFLSARVVAPAPLAALASASMLLLPQIGWESQRDLTHTVLVTTLAAATFHALVLLTRRPRPALYLALGVAAGLGLLAKYSYAVFIVAVLGALALGRETRAAVRSPWMLAAAAVALSIVMPHALWLAEHWPQAVQATAAKLGGPAAAARGARVIGGLGSLTVSVAAFVGPWALVMLLLFGRFLRGRSARSPGAQPMATGAGPLSTRAFWTRYAAVLAVILVGMVLVGDATRFKDRWMQPFLFLVPLAFFACAPRLAQHPRAPWLPRILAGVALSILVLLALRVPVNAWRGRPDELNLPARSLAAALRQHGYDGRADIVTSDAVLGGVLRLHFPDARVQVGAPGSAARLERPLLAIDPVARERVGYTLLDRVARLDGAGSVSEIRLPYRHSPAGSEPARFRWVLAH